MDNLAISALGNGMENDSTLLGVIANNISNINTVGFKKQDVLFADHVYNNKKMVGADPGDGSATPGGVQVGNGSQIVSTTKVFTQGLVNQTGRDLDVAIDGKGFFEVDHPNGTKAYTRDGALRVNAEGQVVTSTGYKLSGFPELKNYDEIYISENGDITVKIGDKLETTKIQLYYVNNPESLENLGNNLYKTNLASGEAQSGVIGKDVGFLRHKYLEMSNVSMADEMIKMILTQRVYEAKGRGVQTVDNMMRVSASLGG